MRTRTTTVRVSYLKTIGLMNNSPVGRGFAHPVDLTIGKDGRIFVLSRHEVFSRVGVCTLDEEYLGEFGSYGHGDGQFWLPTAIAIDGRERVYVADEYHHHISVFESSGDFKGKWGEFGSGEGQVNGPSGLAIDADDNVYVVDQKNNRVQKFTSDGVPMLQWGEAGHGEGQFNLPWGITLDSQGEVYVADWRNDRIQKFTADGRFLAAFGEAGDGDGQFHRPSKPAVDSAGFIYVADWGNERMQILGPDGSFQSKMRGQATVSKWAQEFLDVNPDESVTRDQSDLIPNLPSHLNTPHLISSQTEPYFWGLASVKLDDEDRLFVTESSRHRVQVYQVHHDVSLPQRPDPLARPLR